MTQRGHLVEACLLEEAQEYLVQAQYARVRVTKQAIALRCLELVVRSVAGSTSWSEQGNVVEPIGSQLVKVHAEGRAANLSSLLDRSLFQLRPRRQHCRGRRRTSKTVDSLKTPRRGAPGKAAALDCRQKGLPERWPPSALPEKKTRGKAQPKHKRARCREAEKKGLAAGGTLDPEMAIVASKQQGSSSKCRENFAPESFLSDKFTRNALSSKLPGATWQSSGANSGDHGVDVSGETFKVAVLGMKGDMKWFAAIGCLTRYHGKKGRKRSLHMCNECLAGVASMPYEDMSFRPKWARSLWAERPWDGELNPPPLLVVPFDQSAPERMYHRDVFHITKQGVWRHFIGSVLVVLVQWRYFKVRGESNAAPVQLQRAHSYFVMWCGAFRKIPALRSFTKALLMWKSSWAYPWANVKGSDSTLLMKWLADWLPNMVREARHHEHAEIFEIMCQTAKAGAEFMGDMYNHGAWLSRPCAMKMYESGDKFLTGYTLFAQRFLKMNFCAFNLIPKCHMMKHVLVDTMLALTHGDEYTLNPMTMGCEVNEDLTGKTCRLSRRLDTRTMQRRLLELYLVKAKAVHKRAKARLYG